MDQNCEFKITCFVSLITCLEKKAVLLIARYFEK